MFVIGLDSLFLSRQHRDLTISLTHMANKTEIKNVPINPLPHQTKNDNAFTTLINILEDLSKFARRDIEQ